MPAGSSKSGLGSANLTPNVPLAAASRVTVHDITNFRLITPLAADSLTLDSITAGQDEVTGTSGAVTLVPMSFYNVTNFVIDTDANDGGVGSDTLTVASSGLVASGLQNLTFDAGAGNDSLFLNGTSYQLPVSGGWRLGDKQGSRDCGRELHTQRHEPWYSWRRRRDSVERLSRNIDCCLRGEQLRCEQLERPSDFAWRGRRRQLYG